MFYTYIIYSISADRYYIGQTNNLHNRIAKHNAKLVRSTKAFAPWTLVYFEEFNSRTEAIKRERFLKAQKSKIFIQKLIRSNQE